MFRVLLVVPYPKLEQTVKKIYKEYFRDTEFEVDIRVIQAEEIKHMPWDEAYDLVIGRGHSAAILKQKDNQVPVLEIPITGYDILRALLKAKEQYHATRIAVIVSSAQTHDETILSSILGAQVSVKTCQDFERVSEIIEDVKQNNYDAVVGGYSVTSQALRKHMNAITVETGEEAMIQILHEAARMMGTIYQEHERRKIYETITQTSKEGIIYVNGKKEIALVNKKMLQMIYTDKGLIRGKQLHEVYPFFEEKCAEAIQTKQPVYNAVQNVDNTTFTIDYVPVIVGDKAAGVVITCQTVKKIQQIESQIRKKLSEKGLVAAYTFSDMIRKSDLMESTVNSMEQYLKNMRQISDTVTYNIIQAFDVSSPEFNQQLSFLYDFNKDKIQSIALYDMEGNLIVAEPVTLQKEGIEVLWQPWFENAAEEIENMHFSTPHMQNFFQDDAKTYHWVISLSRAVDGIDGDRPENGILLVDMKYSFIEEMMNRVNDQNRGRYYYVCDGEGNLIYHPYANEISNGLFEEDFSIVCSSEDGVYKNLRSPNGDKQTAIVSTISYTGWKMVGIVKQDIRTDSREQFRIYMVIVVIMLIMMLLLVNRIVSRKISSPILKLDASVRAYEAGEKPDIYIGGSYEIRHLGKSVQHSYEEIERLMKEIVKQQNERRKSELAALQSQINPHFLYNTLESITWMVEANKNQDAVFMISELAKLFRISLSRGKTIISIEDELKHCKNYMNIQKYRYKERFVTEYDVSEEIYPFCTVKLILQPILENAIYYGVGNMDEDDQPKIIVKGWKDDAEIYLSVTDNGMGMRHEDVENILKDNQKGPKHGSGVGLINVHTRIQLMFGNKYGLIVESEPDEGTTVTIHLPAVPYTKENCEALETPGKPTRNEGES